MVTFVWKQVPVCHCFQFYYEMFGPKVWWHNCINHTLGWNCCGENWRCSSAEIPPNFSIWGGYQYHNYDCNDRHKRQTPLEMSRKTPRWQNLMFYLYHLIQNWLENKQKKKLSCHSISKRSISWFEHEKAMHRRLKKMKQNKKTFTQKLLSLASRSDAKHYLCPQSARRKKKPVTHRPWQLSTVKHSLKR